MSGIVSFISEYWWLIPLGLMLWCIFGNFSRRGRGGRYFCCGGWDRPEKRHSVDWDRSKDQ